MSQNAARWGSLFLLVAMLFGALVRFAPAAMAGTVINDGGMFTTMIGELLSNSFRLPAFTSYNHSGIPFAYPPLALYAGAIISALGISTVEVVRWLPALASTAAIPAFYWMAMQMLDAKPKAAVAAAFFALMPRSFSWYIMGGGLSRSFGMLFLLLTCGAAWQMFSKPSWRRVLTTAVLGAAAVLSHPEMALHTAATCALIGLFRGRSVRGARDAAIVAAGVIVLTSPWWGTVIAQHGFSAFASALQTGGHGGPFLITWLAFGFAQEPFVPILTAMGLIGLAVQLVRREWFLPAWTLLPFIVEPRSAPAIAILPLAMLGAIGLVEFVLPKLASLATHTEPAGQDWTYWLACSGAARVLTGIVLLYGFFGAFAYGLSLAGIVVPPASRAAMQWAEQNTPADARFIVLTGSSDPFSDATAEWFPTLASRTSVNTLQGQEWLLGATFMPFMNDLSTLEGCLNRGPDCLDNWARKYDTSYEYVYIQGSAGESPLEAGLLAYQLRRDPNYQIVYDQDGVVIFGRK